MGMGAGDYNNLQRSKERASSRSYRWTRNTIVGLFATAAVLSFDAHNPLIRDTVQRITGSPMQSAPYADRIGHLIEKNVKSAHDFITPYIK